MSRPEVEAHGASRRWTWLFIALAFMAAAAGAWIAWGGTALRDWQIRRTLAGAEAMLRAGNLRAASLAAQQAWSLDPSGTAPRRILISAALRTGNPAALVWQRQLCERTDATPADWLALARMALGFGETALADEALSHVPDLARRNADWHELAGAVAAREGRLPIAELHFRDAARLEPRNALHELNLAAVQLASPDAAIADAARGVLARLAKTPALRLEALRRLLDEARARGEPERARQLAAELATAAGATLDDRLQRVEELRKSDPAAFHTELAALQAQAGAHLPSIASLMRWMNAHGEAAAALHWEAGLPAEFRADPAVAMSAAEALVFTRQWEPLRLRLAQLDWGSADFLRHAFRARAIAGDQPPAPTAAFRADWDQAVLDTRGNFGALTILARQAEAWGWTDRAAEVWWLVAARASGQREALSALFRIYKATGDTAQLYAVAKRIREVEPANPVAKNNVAMLALLLGRDLPEAHRLAAEVHANFPAEPAFASTRAYSLVVLGNAADAVRVMERLPAGPSVEFYRAVALSRAGRRAEAEPVLRRMRESAELLPEEKALAETCLAAP